ncbi:MAG TPA: hypothetical protein VJY62_03870 [Bacteroidia bacterium]|nr:hypothetical protein [Bacteroidia bacterium]
MKKIFITLIISSCFLFACNSSNDSVSKEKEAAIVPDSSLQQNNAPSVSSTPAEMPPAINSGTTTTPVAVPLSSPPNQAAPVAAGMNPAHGQPNHRCDIAVGAPLNSAPTKTVAPDPGTPVTPSISPATSLTPAGAPGNTPITAAPTTTAPGMNPPHGEPGHDCAIPVGAPLKK